jgi:hypothetical protein
MSFWTSLRDTFETVVTLGVYNPARNRMEDQQRRAVNDQIKAYREQTELTQKQIDETRNQANSEKRRVQEKQIRSLRRNYSAAGGGMLGVGSAAAPDMNQKLGG